MISFDHISVAPKTFLVSNFHFFQINKIYVPISDVFNWPTFQEIHFVGRLISQCKGSFIFEFCECIEK